MAQISLKEYLKMLLEGTKDYIDAEDNTLMNSIEGYSLAMNTAVTNIESLIDNLDNKHDEEISTVNNNISSNTTKIDALEKDIAKIKTDLNGKLDSDFVIPWATYDATSKTVQIGAPGSSFYIKSTESGLEIYQGSTKITYWDGGHLKATDITVSNSITATKVTINGLEISGDSTKGWSFR